MPITNQGDALPDSGSARLELLAESELVKLCERLEQFLAGGNAPLDLYGRLAAVYNEIRRRAEH